ncbi:PaaI family thioesterase [Halovulum sp. GXIMD14793]
MELEAAKDVLDSQPFSRLVGAELMVFADGTAEISVDITVDLLQQHGFVHGGMVAYLADNTLTFAGGSVLGNVLTSEIKINYVRPAIGERLVARAHVVSHGRSQAVCRCDIFAIRMVKRSSVLLHKEPSLQLERMNLRQVFARGFHERCMIADAKSSEDFGPLSCKESGTPEVSQRTGA